MVDLAPEVPEVLELLVGVVDLAMVLWVLLALDLSQDLSEDLPKQFCSCWISTLLS